MTETQRQPQRRLTAARFYQIKLMFLAAAFISLALSVGLWLTGSRDEGVFVGLWVPAIHSLGTLILTGERATFSNGGRR